MPNEIDALVVGAGPVGLTMACELRRHGVNCRIIDKAATAVQTSRALGVQARTLEVFENMGVIDVVLAAGTRARGATFHRGDRDILQFSLQHLREKESQYPFLLILPQSQTEAILNQRLQDLGGQVERSRELVQLHQEPDRAIAWVKSADSDTEELEVIHTRWLIGCDGASSQVRQLSAIPFEGVTAPEEWLLADVDLDWPRTRETTHGWFTPQGVFAAFPLPDGQWRLFAPAAMVQEQPAADLSLPLFQHLLERYTGDTTTTVRSATWMSKFKVHYRMVNGYRLGRVLLAGDAAHIHSPFGGQGMNIGIQDAYNLAWKLALVLRQRARETLLDTYQEERSPIATYILRGSQVATQGILATRNPALQWFRDWVLVPLLQLEPLQRKLALEASELTMHYRWSSLSSNRANLGANLPLWAAWWAAPHAGDRALPGPCLSYPSCTETNLVHCFHSTESHLFLFGGVAPTADDYASIDRLAADLDSWITHTAQLPIRLHLVVMGCQKPPALTWDGSLLLDAQGLLHSRYGVQQPSFYFIRPDSYVGFRSQPADSEQLLTYLDTIFLVHTNV